MTASTVDTDHDQDAFPFMRLPPELRLLVYSFALQDITEPIMHPATGQAQKPHPYQGALALLQTNKHLRLESYQALSRVAHARSRIINDTFHAVTKQLHEVRASNGFMSSAYRQASDEHNRALNQFMSMSVITNALQKVMLAHIADRRAHLSRIRGARGF